MRIANKKGIAKKLIAFQLLILGLINGCSLSNSQTTDRQQASTAELTISAAASMQDVLADLKNLYNQKYPQVEIVFNFGSSGSLQQQIEQGAPVDIFISAAPQQMDSLEAKKLLLTNTRQDLVKNQMVLVVPEDNQSVSNFQDLSKKSTQQIALGEPNSVPAGKYAQEILSNLNLVDAVEAKSVYGKNVRQVLNYVATGNVDAGIVYRTDVATAKVKAIAAAPEASHSAVVYPAAVVKDSHYPQVAQQMLAFLLTPEAQAIFKQHGFMSLEDL